MSRKAYYLLNPSDPKVIIDVLFNSGLLQFNQLPNTLPFHSDSPTGYESFHVAIKIKLKMAQPEGAGSKPA
jgi:hypothetical protein